MERAVMLTEELVALASTGGSALVTAMVTDGWGSVRARFAQMFGRGDDRKSDATASRLEQSRSELVAASGMELDRVQQRQQIAWQTRLEDLLEEDPGVDEALRALLTELSEHIAAPAVQVEQHPTAFDQAQQAVLGQGVQSVIFGGQRGPSGR